MGDEVKKSLQDMLNRVHGLYCIQFSDRDGVPLLKISSEKVPEQALRPCNVSTFCLAIDQGSKLGLGKTENLICSYSNYQIVQLNKLPLVVTFIASETANLGHILALENHLEPFIAAMTLMVAEF